MKKILILLFMCALAFGSSLYAAEKLAPVPEGGKLVSGEGTSKEVYIYNNITLADIEKFYNNAFKDYVGASKDSNISDPKTMWSLNDWGNSKWHNITAIDKGKDGVEITILQDSWTWIIGTLVIRFVGVFIILACLMICMYISAFYFSRVESKKKAEAAQ